MILNATTTGFLLNTMLFLANKTNKPHQNSLSDFLHTPMGADSDPDQPRCYGTYGCFPITQPWTTKDRPVSDYPQSPAQINTRFPVYTRHSRMYSIYLDLNKPKDVRFTGINPKGMIYFIAHGYIDSGDRLWVANMMNALLDNDKTGKASVVVIDWGKGSNPPYTQAVANIRLVGVITANVINMMYEELNMKNLDNVHIFGHSLGSHLAGYAGDTLQKKFGLKLGRITAMDPAEPLFGDADPIVRLDRSDAKFIDVIHTDTLPITRGGLGMAAAIGHVDFYPNGGSNNPGCDEPVEHYIAQEKGSFFWGVQTFFSCNHVRSHHFMTESIKSNDLVKAVVCDSYEEFKEGRCFSCAGNDKGYCINFGLESEQSYKKLSSLSKGKPIKAYFMTSEKPPYFQSHYKIKVVMSDLEESRAHGGEIGILSAEIEARNGNKSGAMTFSRDPVYFEPGYEYSAVLSGKEAGIPKLVRLNWEYKTNPLNPLTWRILATPRVYIKYIEIESMEHNSKATMCSMYGNPVVANAPTDFLHDYCNDYRNLPK